MYLNSLTTESPPSGNLLEVVMEGFLEDGPGLSVRDGGVVRFFEDSVLAFLENGPGLSVRGGGVVRFFEDSVLGIPFSL